MIDVHLDTDGTGHLSLPSGSRTIAATSLSQARADVIVILTNQAQTSGRILQANVSVTGEGTTTLEVHPNGTINEITTPQPQEPVMTASTPQPEPVVETQPTAAPAPARPAQAPQAQSVSPAAPVNTGPRPQAAPASPATQATPLTDGFITTDLPVARSFVKQSKDVPAEGFRGFVTKASGGLVNPGLSRRELHRRELHQRVAKPITGTRNIVFMCLKGGISKTSTTCGVGLSLAEFRPDAVLAVDTNPDAGDLADRLIGHDQVESLSPRTITDLVGALEARQIDSLTDLNRYTQTSGRLHFIAGEQDPDVSESLTAEQYISVRDTVDRFYPITLTDCGTGVTHPAMKGGTDAGFGDI